MLEHSCDTEVTNFYGPILVHKDVLCFQVSVQDLPIVDVLDGESHLHEPVEDLVLAIANFTYFLLVCNLGIQIAAICIVHYYTKASFVHEGLFVRDNVRMPHCLEHMYLVDCVFSLLPVHLGDINDFHYVGLPISNGLHEDCKTE